MGCKSICLNYKAVKVSHSKRYANGQVRCMNCNIFMNYTGLFCPCCGIRVRTKPRNAKYKNLFNGAKTDHSIKFVYVGKGKDPKLKLFINPEYMNLIPRVTVSKYEEMKKAIIEDGQYEPVTANESGMVLDGHTRYSICSELGIPIKYDVKHFNSIDDERKYVITSNLKRRQLNKFQMIELSQSIREIYQKETEENKRELISKIRKGELKPIPVKERLALSTGYRLAELLDVGTTTIDKANYIVDHGTEKEKQSARSGESSLEHIYKKVVNRRHADPNVTKRNARVLPLCQKCGSDTRFKGKCHVHSHYCCRKCSWGN